MSLLFYVPKEGCAQPFAGSALCHLASHVWQMLVLSQAGSSPPAQQKGPTRPLNRCERLTLFRPGPGARNDGTLRRQEKINPCARVESCSRGLLGELRPGNKAMCKVKSSRPISSSESTGYGKLPDRLTRRIFAPLNYFADMRPWTSRLPDFVPVIHASSLRYASAPCEP